MSSCIFTLLLISSILTANVNEPIYLDNSPKVFQQPKFENGVLKGGVSVDYDLPEGFYGTWSVLSKITKNDHPEIISGKGSDIWIFYKDGDIITLTNPNTGATSSITVNDVQGNTAIFTREKITDSVREYETPKVTIDGDSFIGTDKILTEYYKKGKLVRTSVVEYEIKGIKISGPTIKQIFGR